MRTALFAVVALAAGAVAQLPQEEKYAPIPYQFAYKAESAEGSNSQEETSDGNGRVQGSYSIALADGRQRIVTYWADETGFHADVNTNELGTESKNAADAKYSSSAITGEQAAVQYGPQFQAEKKVYQAPVVKVQAPAPTIVKTIQSAPIVKTYAAPTVTYAAPAPTYTYVKAAPTVVKTFQTAPTVVKSYQAAPAVVKTIQTAPVAAYSYEHAPVTYTTHDTAPYTYVSGDIHGDFHKA